MWITEVIEAWSQHRKRVLKQTTFSLIFILSRSIYCWINIACILHIMMHSEFSAFSSFFYWGKVVLVFFLISSDSAQPLLRTTISHVVTLFWNWGHFPAFCVYGSHFETGSGPSTCINTIKASLSVNNVLRWLGTIGKINWHSRYPPQNKSYKHITTVRSNKWTKQCSVACALVFIEFHS